MTNRNTLLTYVKAYFNIKELVCKLVYDKYKETAWQFISTELLSILYTLRYEIIKKPMIVNNWHTGGTYTQRGLRCNTCQLVKTKKVPCLSAHVLGKAVDFHVNSLSAEEVRELIKSNVDKFEYPIRLEEGTTWVHVDAYTQDSSIKLVTFTE